jgi:ribosomal protein S18 acetylase RimI-like enzyme
MTAYTWRPLTPADVPALAALDQAARAADGPISVHDPAWEYLLDDLDTGLIGAEPADGGLLAAAGWVQRLGDHARIGGTVHPAHRRRGLGTHLLGWAAEEARRLGTPTHLIIRNEALTPAAAALYAKAGYTLDFAELWMEHTGAAPAVPAPALPSEPWTEATAPQFYAAYCAAFATRPHFHPHTAETWIADYAEDPDFRPDLSRVVLAEGVPVAFLAAALMHLPAGETVGWVAQVGVAPAWRGRGHGIGGGLIAEMIRAFQREGIATSGLHVNRNNAEGIGLYTRLGFRPVGERARYSRAL